MKNYNICDGFEKQGLYNPKFEHDACGIGSVVNIRGEKSNYVLDSALKIVENLEHRAGKDAEGKTGDGVGILTQISDNFFIKEAEKSNIVLKGERNYAIAMVFFPQDEEKRKKALNEFELAMREEDLEIIWWRNVPVCPEVIGTKARESLPEIMQAFIARPEYCKTDMDFERKLYIARRVFEKKHTGTYVCSCSCRTIVYKGMFLVHELRAFYKDLQSPNFDTAIAVVHSRFSTNTNPSWQKAHPNRIIVHNGEINTITGNVNKMFAREPFLKTDVFGDELKKVFPVIDTSGSDSARLDNALEFMNMSGIDLPLAVMMCIPEPWKNDKGMSAEKKEFYHYWATMMEPWDGPASIIFSDGDIMGAVLDRNGLRPSRYCITKDGFLILSSEVGAVDIPEENVMKKERLHPGKMLLVDTVKGRLIEDDEIKEKYSKRHPYGEWLDKYLVTLKSIPSAHKAVHHFPHDELIVRQKAFGYTWEDIQNSIIPLAAKGSEPVSAMGCDRALPPLSDHMPPLFDYFHQLFAQVTNPPIDSIREKIVTDTEVYAGVTGNILEEKAENCHALQIENPILTNLDMMKIKNYAGRGFKISVIPILYKSEDGIEKAMNDVISKADEYCAGGTNIIVLTDKGSDRDNLPIPSLLAVSGLHNHLVRSGKSSVSIILESGEPRSIHHFATLLGMGAIAVNPYLAQNTIHDIIDKGILDREYVEAEESYNKGILDGILKIASKMGISTIQSYQGSKIFEAIGLSYDVMDKYFEGVESPIGGTTLEQIEQRQKKLSDIAYSDYTDEPYNSLESLGLHKERSGKEYHLYNPQTIHLLQLATSRGDYSLFKEYEKLIDREDKNVTLRSLLEIKYPEKGIPLDEVEPASEIVKRFKTGAMSYGSISKEAHETMAIAMNRLGGKSNTGEGGESPERIATKGKENSVCSAIKQVASGRFGVTSDYLVSADEIQIKMAQGAKPGEGGHLPAGKVYPWVAKTRHSTPGVSLISPPPHHDIYSIEDLAQLIYDLKNSNKNARISVKLVSEAGVGTVAAGVAKAGAEVILISGFDGGTGAAPMNSIYNAGMPWELGLVEAHQTLILNGLRDRVRIETDGKLMTGKDVLIAAMLGAEEFGFATAPLVTMGCVMMRVCNLDTCPVGVATQNPELRKRFRGKPEYVMNFMLYIAESLREYMAKLGIRTIDELVGRSDLLKVRDFAPGEKGSNIDFSKILDSRFASKNERHIFVPEKKYDFKLENTPDEKVLCKEFKDSFENEKPAEISINVKNTDRAFGTLFGSEITKKFGESLDDDFFTVHAKGSGGQSFGAFIPKGLTLELEGDSNDYFGKGLSGGKLIIFPSEKSTFRPENNIIVGNVALYGATSGKVFINGIAGERFAVRNSGATAVVEGVGDHGCEYMTGGVVVVLGTFGKNFAAGMSGGIAYVYDENDSLYRTMNQGLASYSNVMEKEDLERLEELIKEHYEATGSPKAKRILDDFGKYSKFFKKILPYDYARMLMTISSMKEKGLSDEEAQMQAFNVNTGKRAVK